MLPDLLNSAKKLEDLRSMYICQTLLWDVVFKFQIEVLLFYLWITGKLVDELSALTMREIECIFANANYMSWPIAARQIQHRHRIADANACNAFKKKVVNL